MTAGPPRSMVWLAAAAAALLAAGAVRAAEIRGSVEAGSVGNEVAITVTNTSGESAVEGLQVAPLGAPRLLTNVRISPSRTERLAPGQSQPFTITFDARADAPPDGVETLSFRVSARKGARVDPPDLRVTVKVEARTASTAAPGAPGMPGAAPVFTLVSIEGNADRQPPAPLSATGERVAGEWVPWSISGAPPGTKVSWALQSVFRVPATIKLGEEFTIGLCGAAAFGHAGGQPRRLGLEHLTEVNALGGGTDVRAASVARSVQSLAFPDGPAKETAASQEARLLFRYNAARSRPPDAFVYDAIKVMGQAPIRDRDGLPGGLGGRQPSSALHILVGKTADREGLLGTGDPGQDSQGKLAYIEVVLREELAYGLSRFDLGQTFSRWWLLRYRPLKPGEAAPSFGPPGHARGDECPPVSTALTTVAGPGTAPSSGAAGGTGAGRSSATPGMAGAAPAAAGTAGAAVSGGVDTTPGIAGGGGRSATAATGGTGGGGASVAPETGGASSASSASPADGTTGGAGRGGRPDGTAGAGGARATPETGGPGGAGLTAIRPRRDPAAIDPRSSEAGRLIEEWLRIAEPPDNARGARLRYDGWGRAQGTGIHGERITPGPPPDGAAGKTPAEFAWTLRDALDSIDHCTLGEFVTANLGGGSTDRCRGRRRPAPSTVVTVERVLDLSVDEAEARLRALGLVARPEGGDPAPSPALAFKVYDQAPRAGAQAPPGSAVRIIVHSAYDAQRAVPDLAGLTVDEATARLQSLGLVARPEGGDPAPAPEQQFRVYRQRPGAGSALAPGGTVSFTVHGAFVAMATLPDVVGLPFDQARARLEAAGFTVTHREVGRASSPAQAFTVSAQEPAATSQVRPGQQVVVKTYARFEDSRCERLLDQAQGAARAARAGEALQRYREARQLGCETPGLDGAIAGLEQRVQQQARQAEEARRAEQARQAQEAQRAEQARQAQAAQQAWRCDALIQQGNAASSAGRAQEALNFYVQARQLGCAAAGLDNAIAGLDQRLRAQQARQAEQARQAQEAQRAEQARQAQAAEQVRRCDAVIQQGNAASNGGRAQEALNLYVQARQLRCNATGLDSAIAGLERRIQHDRQCTSLIQQGNAANSSGQFQGALNAYRQARGAGCGSPQLDTVIAQIENRLRASPGSSGGGTTRPAPPRPPTGGSAGSIPAVSCPPGMVWAPGGLLGQGPDGQCVAARR